MAIPQFSKIEVPYQKVLARLGFAHGKTALDTRSEESIREAIALSKKLIVPQRVIASSPIAFPEPGTTQLEPSFTIASVKIYELLKSCREAYGFAVTIGPHLEEKRNMFIAQKETNRGLILDAVGSVIAEELADLTQQEIRQSAQTRGEDATMRFSPGYGDWILAGQPAFLAWLGAESIGIKLTPSYQMIPEKSVSAIFGIYKKSS